MTNWLTEQEIVERFVIGERCLHRFSRNGMLPRRTSKEGKTFFAEDFVSATFRRRGSVTLQVVDQASHLGILGAETRLGEPARPSAGAHEVAA